MTEMLPCYRCRYFIGQYIDGTIECKRLGHIPYPMIWCLYYAPKEGDKDDC